MHLFELKSIDYTEEQIDRIVSIIEKQSGVKPRNVDVLVVSRDKQDDDTIMIEYDIRLTIKEKIIEMLGARIYPKRDWIFLSESKDIFK